MARLSEVVAFLDRELRTAEIPDYPGAHNGLQLQNQGGELTRVAAAVDASLEVIDEAVELGADLLIVHHGLFWQGVRMFTGPQYQKIKRAMDAGLAIYSSHIPLDVHPLYGNNALLAKSLGMEVTGTFMPWKGIELGLRANSAFDKLTELESLIEKKVGPVISSHVGEAEVGELGIITGGAGSEVEAAAAEGISTFITGEGPHWSFPLARELGLKVIHAGHYATETFGVREMAKVVGEKFGLEGVFIDRPTGL
ncbi:MAG: Nif3-like dinuclear metal center hexameric protein [Verrucomicrobiota bacterium JB023]|nr:Nif3-like dinuclear metal center hexameric protein [Verrucomicrobiota bacterium JB023]